MNKKNQKSLALFDFDGTITKKDSLIDFIKYAVGTSSFYIGLIKLSPMLFTYTFKLIPNHLAKEKLISHYFKDWEISHFKKIADTYSQTQIQKIIRPKAIEKINWHHEQNHDVVIVSASIECWLKVFCTNNNITLISTKLEVKNNKLTGKFLTKNCHGLEKVNRVKEIYNLKSYNYIYAYGDSNGDTELLTLANESFYKPFRNRKTI